MSRFGLKKGVFFLGMIILMVVALWYVIKPYDYTVAFKSEAGIGTINQTLKLWNVNLNHSQPMHQIGMDELVQKIKLDGTEYVFRWKLTRANDSTTQINIGIRDPQHSLSNKMSILFNDSDFEKKVKQTVDDFILVLSSHLEKFEVQIIGKATFPTTYCAYIPIRTKQFLKGRGMMENYGVLSTFLLEHEIILNGQPIVEILSWDIETDSISFNFCFPILKQENLPVHPKVKYKEIKGLNAVKALYQGNYITSDRAWYSVLDYAKANSILLKNTPIEVFNNNPAIGGNELNWQTEIYLPIDN